MGTSGGTLEGLGLTSTSDFWKDRQVLVTGHTGFKGAWLVLWLQHLGAQVSGLALKPEHELGAFQAMSPWPGLVSTTVDLRDTGAVAAVAAEADPEVVFHLGAQALVGRGYADPVGTYATNVIGTANLLAAFVSAPSLRAAVVVTSDKVYRATEPATPFKEGDALGGVDPYSASKACAELVVDAWRHGPTGQAPAVATARAGNVIGGGDRGEGRLLPDVLAALEAGVPVRLRSPGAVRPWQHVLEPISGYLALAERLFLRPNATPPALNFGPHRGTTAEVADLTGRVLALWGTGTWEPELGSRPLEAETLLLDSSLAHRELGWSPRLGLDDAVEWTVAWWRAQRAGDDMRKVSVAQIEAYEAAASPASP